MSGTRVHRLLQLINAMRSGQAYTADELAAKLAISRRTVFRDLELLERSGVPCRYDPHRRGYRIDEWYFLPPVSLSLPEALGLYVAAMKVTTPQTFPLAAEARRAVEKVTQALPGGLRGLCLRMAETIEVRGQPTMDATAIRPIFRKLHEAAVARRKVQLKYDSYFEKREIAVTVHPYLLALLNRAWYLVGHCEGHRQVRTFNLDRILSTDVLNDAYPEPNGFALDDHLGKAWLMIPEGRTWSVRLRFGPKVAGNVEEIVWHTTQRTQRLPDGSLIFEVDVDGLAEISWWIMGYGDQVVVEKPAELRSRVLQMAQGIVRLYDR